MSTSGDAERLVSSPPKIDQAISLRAVIDARKRLDELGTARLIGEAADVVHKAQSQGQPLGKLAPETIVVRTGTVALDLTAAASLAYSAPERLRGGGGDRRSDVFSLGAILWEALTHVRLFEGANDDAIKAAVLRGEIHPVSELNANVPAELDAICKKALARDPADRYQSCKVMAAEISAVLDDAGYPETNEGITKWIAGEFPDGPPTAKPAPKPGTTTVMGISPLRIDEQQTQPVVKAEPAHTVAAPPAPPEPAKPEPPKPVPAAGPVVSPPSVLGTIPPITKPATPEPAKPEPPRAAASTAPPATKPAEPAPTKSPIEAANTKARPVSHDDDFNTQVEAKALPPSALPSWATAKPATTPPPTTTLTGVTTPSMAVLNAPTVPTSVDPVLLSSSVPPGMKLPDGPPGATISAKPAPAIGATTAILGSPNSPPAAPSPAFSGTRTAVLGSNAIIEATNAAVSAANPPEPAPPPVAHKLPSPFKKPSISEAETVATPAVSPVPLAPVLPAGALKAAAAIEPPTAGGAPPSADDFAESGNHPAAVVALSAPRRDSTGTGKADVLAGWGWGTGAQDIIREDEEVYADDAGATKKRLLYAVGGAVGVVLIIAVVAFAFSGKKKKDDPTAKAKTNEAPLVDPTATPAQPPKPEPAKPEPPKPEVAEPPKPETAVAEPPKPEPAVAEPPKPEPPKPEPPKPEPPKAEPPKPEPPKVVAKVEPKPEPPKVVPKVPPKVAKEPPKKPDKKPDVAIKKPDKKPKDAGIPKPVDPYAPQALKLDAAAAYKTGLQQFAKGDSPGALATFKASLASEPGFAPTWRGIGLVYEKLGKKSQAVTAFKRYLQLSPNAGDADQIRGRLERLGS